PIAYRVAFVSGMLAAVDFDDEPLLAADEVDNIGSDRLLTHEFVTHQGACAQMTPQTKLRLGGICPQSTGTCRLELVGSAHADNPPHPTRFARRPLPASGERCNPHNPKSLRPG